MLPSQKIKQYYSYVLGTVSKHPIQSYNFYKLTTHPNFYRYPSVFQKYEKLPPFSHYFTNLPQSFRICARNIWKLNHIDKLFEDLYKAK